MSPGNRHPAPVDPDIDLAACVRGDKAAWDRFVERYAGVILSAVRRAIGSSDPARIEDPVQDVYVRLVRDDFRLLRTFDGTRASLSTWLTLIARSAAIDHLRKRRRTTEALPTEELAAPGTAETPDTPAIPLHLLSGRQRLVLRLLFDEERSVPEAAAFLGVDEQTIRSTKHKALTRLRTHFKKSGDAGPPTGVSQD